MTLNGYASLHGRNLFKGFEPFASHFKNWNDKFFKILFPLGEPDLFSFPNGRPKFPIYWLKRSNNNFAIDFSSLSIDEQKIVNLMCRLPVINSKSLLDSERRGNVKGFLDLQRKLSFLFITFFCFI